MNRHQVAAALRLTTQANQMAERLQEPAMVWQVLPVSQKTVELRGSSCDVERRWFDNSRLFQAFIGPRGRVTISSATDKLYA